MRSLCASRSSHIFQLATAARCSLRGSRAGVSRFFKNHQQRSPACCPFGGGNSFQKTNPAYLHARNTGTMASYSFPASKLLQLQDNSKTPLVVISCGSFSPITHLHMRMFEMCRDWCRLNSKFEVVGGYLSPVADAYKKKGLAKADDRIKMCDLAVKGSEWVMVDDWEARKEEYTTTILVLDHFAHEINEVLGGVQTSSGERKKAHVAMLSGADLVQTFATPGVWAPEDIEDILVRYGLFVVERGGTDLQGALEPIQKWKQYIHVIPQNIPNDISSTKVRKNVSEGLSIRYLVADEVMDYISKHGLYRS